MVCCKTRSRGNRRRPCLCQESAPSRPTSPGGCRRIAQLHHAWSACLLQRWSGHVFCRAESGAHRRASAKSLSRCVTVALPGVDCAKRPLARLGGERTRQRQGAEIDRLRASIAGEGDDEFRKAGHIDHARCRKNSEQAITSLHHSDSRGTAQRCVGSEDSDRRNDGLHGIAPPHPCQTHHLPRNMARLGIQQIERTAR